MSKLRWGIIGTARIARKNWKAIRYSGNSVVTAVASRDVERSRTFVAECQAMAPFESVPAVGGSYEALLASKDVDAVYVPVPTGLRKALVLRAAEAGKHVLCEKPCGCSADDLREMIDACRRHGVQFMDGVMFMHNPRMERIRQALNDVSSMGAIRRITSHFSFLASDDFLQSNIRADSALEPLGCLGDLGWYCVRFALWTMDWRLPGEVHGRMLSQFTGSQSAAPVPSDFSAELLFDGGVSAGFYCSFLTTYRQWSEISGTRGHVRVPDFVLPMGGGQGSLEINGEMRIDSSEDPAELQETRMIRNFADQVLSGRLDDSWPEMALKTQTVVDACLRAARGGISAA